MVREHGLTEPKDEHRYPNLEQRRRTRRQPPIRVGLGGAPAQLDLRYVSLAGTSDAAKPIS